MLQLNIKNFALIENLSIDFSEGFHVFTGETGAGKSILIDAISYLLGAKFSKDNVRYGEDKIVVEGIFAIDSDSTKRILIENDIDFEDTLIIYRETLKNGKSIIKVNGKAIIASLLKKITSTLINIHGQNENQNLLQESMHIEYLDYFGAHYYKDELKEYKDIYVKYMDMEEEFNRLNSKNIKGGNKLDYIKYQLDDITSSNLKAGEEEELEERYNVLNNSEKIINTLSDILEDLDGEDDKRSISYRIKHVVRELGSINKYINVESIMNCLDDFYYGLKDNALEIRNILEDTSFDPFELEKINSRLYDIALLKKKYGDSIAQILQYKENIEKEWEELIHLDELLEDIKNKRKLLQDELINKSYKLHEKRVEISKNLDEKIMNELSYIGMEKAKFKVNVELDKLNDKGMDRVSFLISANPGEPLKNLDKVASGGELSRVMLALKTIFIDKEDIPSVIFDEIDTGVSGRIAESIGEKLYTLSKGHQVFCVTHLPQIASFSDVHYHIKKEIINDKTFTRVLKLNEEEKVEEIARMISGKNITKTSLNNSKEIIILSSKKKLNL